MLDDQTLPTHSSIDKWIDDAEYQNGIWAFVDIDLSKISGKTKRINITVPERVLNLIDLYGKSHAIKNRSAFLTDAAVDYIANHQHRVM